MFQRFSGRIAAVTFAALLSQPLAAFANQMVAVPGGTEVRVESIETVSSATAHKGDTFEIRAVNSVVRDGWVVIPEGAHGQAEIVDAEPAGSHGHPGTLVLKYDWIYSADGGKIQLSDINQTQAGEGQKGKSSTVTILSTAFLGVGGLFAHNFVKGSNVELNSNKLLSCVVDHTVHVEASQRGQSGDFDK